MCQNVPPLELFDHFLYKYLRPTWREAIVAVIVRLHIAGDGQLADEWLLQGLLNNKYRPLFVDRMIEYGWLVRVDGKLCRAGVLAPSAATATAEEEHPARSAAAEAVANTRAMQLNARLTRIETELGLAVAPAQTSRETLTNGAAPSNKSSAANAQTVRTEQTSPTQTANKSDQPPRARPASPTDLQTEGESDGLSVGPTPASPELQIDTRYPIDEHDSQDAKLLAILAKEKFPPDIVRSVVGNMKPGDRYKIKDAITYCRNIVKNRAADELDRQRKTPGLPGMLHGAVSGGAASQAASKPSLSNAEVAARVRAEFEQKVANQ